MRERSLGIAAAAMLSVTAGAYCLVTGLALLVGGAVAIRVGSDLSYLVLALGVVFLGIAVAGSVIGFGLWNRWAWAWSGAAILFTVVIAANLFLSIMAANFANLVMPVIGTAAALAILSRPEVKAAFFRRETATAASGVASGGVEMVSHLT